MKFPAISGTIRRRILVNFRVKPSVLQALLPAPFEPKLHNEWAMAGICLIRLEQIRPSWMPLPLGIASENAAHRMAVCWTDENGESQEGVYIPRRDSSSLLNYLVGGRFFPGEHHRTEFRIVDDRQRIELNARAFDGSVSIELNARAEEDFPENSIFSSLAEASRFFERGSTGYSATASGQYLDGVVLVTRTWKVNPLAVDSVQSSFFQNKKAFPEGSIEFDCALIMRDIEHEWRAAPSMEICNQDCLLPS